jgi:hypothetical protein
MSDHTGHNGAGLIRSRISGNPVRQKHWTVKSFENSG